MIKNISKVSKQQHTMATYADQYEWLKAQPKWRTIVNNAGIKGISRNSTVESIITNLKVRFPHIKLPWNDEAIKQIRIEKDFTNQRNNAVGSLQSIFNTSHHNIMKLSKYEKILTPEQEITLQQLINLREFPKTFKDKVYEAHAQKNELKLLKYCALLSKMHTDLLETISKIDYDELYKQYRLENPIRPNGRTINISGEELLRCKGDLKTILLNKLN